MKRYSLSIVVIVTAAIAFVLGYGVHLFTSPPDDGKAPQGAGAQVAEAEEEPTIWTCSMHPQVRRTEPGLCPICKMDLIEVERTRGVRYRTSQAGKALMEIETAPAERRLVDVRVRMTGTIDVDETRLGTITARMPGRIDRLFVDTKGIPVRKGDHMVELYSPELIAAQEELIQTRRAVDELPEGEAGIVRQTARDTLQAAREKLRLWGLTPEQIRTIEQQKRPRDHITLYAPMGGIVVGIEAREGEYVNTGAHIYSIADLSQLWVNLDAYESDLAWIRYGQTAAIATEAYPGETFEGRISFIQPVLDRATRTVPVRVTVPNPDGRLKPGMFVRGTVHSTIAAGGRVVDPELAGKYICRMHPEVIREDPGACPVCGMPLEKTSEVGFVPVDDGADLEKPLVVPASAPLVTGRRAVVYVEVPNTDMPTYEGREVVLGPRAGDYYIIKEGLEEGERVVTHGAFKIDSALQILAKPSMMSRAQTDEPAAMDRDDRAATDDPPARKTKSIPIDGRGAEALGELWTAYIEWREALADDDAEVGAKALRDLKKSIGGIDPAVFDKAAREVWREAADRFEKAFAIIEEPGDIESQRKGFVLVSDELADLLTRLDPDGLGPVYKLHCPMAFNNRGAAWLQKARQVDNPYFGASMLRCGSVTETIRKDEE